jgi:hypothetical protein
MRKSNYRHAICTATLICLFFALFGCSKKSNPVDSTNTNGTLLYTSFEVNGAPSLENWQNTFYGYTPYVQFSRDVPTNSGSWSLLLRCDTVYRSGVIYASHCNNSQNNDSYVLSYWAKCIGKSFGTIQFAMFASSNVDGIGPQQFVFDSIWQSYSTTIVTPTKADSIEIVLGSSTSLTGTPLTHYYYPHVNDSGYVLYDGIQLIQKHQ